MSTGIEWTDETWNPVRGCSLVSDGCTNCYAMEVAARFSGPGLPYEGLARRRSNGKAQWTGKVRVVEDHMNDPIRWRKPRRIFVNSMSDLFHEKVTDAELDRMFAVMALASHHTFQILTKRPERMLAYLTAKRERVMWDQPASESTQWYVWSACSDFERPGFSPPWMWKGMDIVGPWPLPNVWLGVSVEDQKAAEERIPLLLQTPAVVRFLSCEPLLGQVDLRAVRNPHDMYHHCLSEGVCFDARHPRVNWVIVGGESGHGARPCDVAWVRLIVQSCRGMKVPVFVKQLGSRPEMTAAFNGKEHTAGVRVTGKGGDMAEWPEDLRVRQFPGEVPA